MKMSYEVIIGHPPLPIIFGRKTQVILRGLIHGVPFGGAEIKMVLNGQYCRSLIIANRLLCRSLLTVIIFKLEYDIVSDIRGLRESI